MVNRSEPQVFALQHQPWATAGAPSVAAGAQARTVSVDEGSGASTLLARLPAGWQAEAAAPGATEMFVLEGELTVAGGALRSGGYCHPPRGRRSGQRARRAAGRSPFVFWAPAPSIVVAHRDRRPLRAGTFPGRPPRCRASPPGRCTSRYAPGTPRSAPSIGGVPTASCSLVLSAPGWLSPREERHVDCWEENILLRGDMLMPGRGTLRAGDCLANQPGLWHGPMVTKGGALFLVNCDAPMRVEYRDHPPGAAELDRVPARPRRVGLIAEPDAARSAASRGSSRITGRAAPVSSPRSPA